MKILVVNGPNLNLLGLREPEKYGLKSLDDIIIAMKDFAQDKSMELVFFQSNSEGEIINFLQNNYPNTDYLIINPGGLTHTSIALRDTILGLKLATIEIHLSNIYNREEFRKQSYFSDISLGIITGLGWYGYILALDYINKVQSLKK